MLWCHPSKVSLRCNFCWLTVSEGYKELAKEPYGILGK
jgi:hypothetical protein